MADHADGVDAKIFETVAAGLAAVRRRMGLLADGRCHFCDEEVLPEILFCNDDCRDDYQKEETAKVRNGR